MHTGLVRILVPLSLLVVASGVSDREVASGSAVHQRAARVVIQGTVTDVSTSLAHSPRTIACHLGSLVAFSSSAGM